MNRLRLVLVDDLPRLPPVRLRGPRDRPRERGPAMMISPVRTTAHQLFRDLLSAEETARSYAELAAIIESSARVQLGGPRSEIARRELARLIDLAEEFENDADHRRDAIISAGYTPEQYEAWLTRLSFR